MKHRLLNKDKSKIVDEYGQLKIIAKMVSDEISKRKKLIDEFVDDRDTLVGMDFQINVIRKTARNLNIKALEDKFGAEVIDGFRNKYTKRVEYQPKPLDEKNSSRLVRKAVRTSVRELVDIKQAVNLL
tara:strand:+ start:164 stop:547 length:384 start_codon:yes stop_codon:yes gene_type:complete